MFPHTYLYEEILGGVEGVKGEEMGSWTTAPLIFSSLFTLVFIQFPFSLGSGVARLAGGNC